MIEDFKETSPKTITEVSSTLELSRKEIFSLPYISEETDFLKHQVQKNFTMNATALQ